MVVPERTRPGDPSSPRAAAPDAPTARIGVPLINALSGPLLLALVVALHLALLLGVFPNTREDVVLRGFLSLSYSDGGRALTGAVPYRDFLLEYPLGSLVFMMAPYLFSVGYLEYRTAFFVEVALLDVVVLVALYAVARATAVSVRRALGFYTLAIVLLGPLVDYRLDLAPAALTALAMLAWRRGRLAWAAIALAAGTATKAYPLLLLPLLLADSWSQGRRRQAVGAAVLFVGALAVLLSPALLASPSDLSLALQFQTGRRLQVESLWATPPLLLHLIAGFPLEIAGRARALVVLGPGDAWGAAGAPTLALVSALVYWRWWRLRRRAELRVAAMFVGAAALVLAAAMLSKVLSPQYVLWVMPALAMLPLPRGQRILPLCALGAFLAALPLTQWLYPLHYGEFVRLIEPTAVIVLATRNLLLALALIALLATLWQLDRAT